jgi:L-rhamnose isomerase/sugar isomerase
MDWHDAYQLLEAQLTEQGIDCQGVIHALKAQQIETPSWGYANSGTRFKTFAWAGAARTTQEKIADAAMVHKMTGIAPSVALHIPWDAPQDGDYLALREYATEQGIRLGAINPNVFQEDVYRLGSLGHPSPATRELAVDHLLECCEIMRKTGSDLLSLWFADGTNYPGQDSLPGRKARFLDGLAQVYRHLPAASRMLIEYKFFEPAFYSTDIPDWGTAYAYCLKLGAQAFVLVDLGHHAPGVNIEQIVAFLLDEGRLGGFHFNNRKYADDDLIVGSVNPFELFLIYHELVSAAEGESEPARSTARHVAYMIDQSHNIEGKLASMILSVLNCQEAYARALIVPHQRLVEAQQAGEVLQAHQILVDAFRTDVRPLLMRVRQQMGVPLDPLQAYAASGYEQAIASQRGVVDSASGYPI